MAEVQRFRNNKKLIDAINFLKLEFPVKEISERMNVGKGNVSSFVNNKVSVSKNFIEKFEEEFKIELEGFEFNKNTKDEKDNYENLGPEKVLCLNYKELYLNALKMISLQNKYIEETVNHQ